MAIKSMYADKLQEIIDMMVSGMTYQAMVNRLQAEGIPAKMYSLWNYFQRVENPRFTPAPHCKACKHYLIVESAERSGGHMYVCLDAKKEIRGSCQTSPWWCGKRNKS